MNLSRYFVVTVRVYYLDTRLSDKILSDYILIYNALRSSELLQPQRMIFW